MIDSQVKSVYNQIDALVKDEKNCCSKGCSACCFQQIEVLKFERESIKSFLKHNLDSNIKLKIKIDLDKYLDVFDKNTPNRILNDFDVFTIFSQTDAKGLKCPLLVNNLCSIYEMRPAACRIHYVENDPELCETNRTRNSALNGIKVRNELFKIAKSKGEESIEPLTYIIAEELLPNRKLKKIEKVIF